MKINRREFVILTGACAAGCAGSGNENMPVVLHEASIDAGSATDYTVDGVYDRFRDRGFFVVRQGEQLYALSSMCTHRACKVSARPDHSFHCKCHGSTFDPKGGVMEGPAIQALPLLPTEIGTDGRLRIKALVNGV